MNPIDPPPKDPHDRDWLHFPVEDNRPPIKIISTTTTPKSPYGNSIEFTGLTTKEKDAIEAFTLGATYLRTINGRLHAYHVYNPLPPPETDPLLEDHYPTTKPQAETPQKTIDNPPAHNYSPTITISGLGAGSTNKHAYKHAAKKLTRWGFHCSRSPRQENGQIWEYWILPYLLAAKNELANEIQPHTDNHTKAEKAIQFLIQNVPLSSIDITTQRYGLPNPD